MTTSNLDNKYLIIFFMIIVILYLLNTEMFTEVPELITSNPSSDLITSNPSSDLITPTVDNINYVSSLLNIVTLQQILNEKQYKLIIPKLLIDVNNGPICGLNINQTNELFNQINNELSCFINSLSVKQLENLTNITSKVNIKSVPSLKQRASLYNKLMMNKKCKSKLYIYNELQGILTKQQMNIILS